MLKQKIRNLLVRATGSQNLDRRLSELERFRQSTEHDLAGLSAYSATGNSADPVNNFPIPKFWERNYCEPTVQLPLYDYLRPGDVAFDVGANAGALALIMSRLVGPRGTVCAFEASPRIIPKTHHNLVSGGCANVQLIHRTIFHTTGEFVELFPGTHFNDSIYNKHGSEYGSSHLVETLSLDDFCDSLGCDPKLIKIDIEGAEMDALRGAERMIARAKPLFILEQSPSDMRCHEFLTSRGYRAVDLSTYRLITTGNDFEPGSFIANVLFVHPSNHPDDPYLKAVSPEKAMTLPADRFKKAENGSISMDDFIELPAGRYICEARFEAKGEQNEVIAGIEDERGPLFRYHTYSGMLEHSYRQWVFALRRPTQIRPYFTFLKGTDPSFKWHGFDVLRLPAFDGMKYPVIY